MPLSSKRRQGKRIKMEKVLLFQTIINQFFVPPSGDGGKTNSSSPLQGMGVYLWIDVNQSKHY